MHSHTLTSHLYCYMACLLLGLLCSAGTAVGADEADLGPGVGLTVYNQDFAVIKERRLMRLGEGNSVVKFPEVAATMVPESVQFGSLRPGGAKVLEQNFEFDLVSADRLLQKYIDRQIGIVGRDGSLTEGTLLSADDGQLVLSNSDGIQLIPRAHGVKDVRFSSLPEGLLTRPTLVWKVHSPKDGEHLVKITYLARGINWRTDYRAVASADEETIDLSGWVTIQNESGATFKDAGLKLMAGDVHVLDTEQRLGVRISFGFRGRVARKGKGLDEKSFAEYHLYTLGRRTTLANNQTKQIELLKVEGIPATKSYLYRSSFGTRVATILSFKNSKQTHPGLGIPLPKGPFRAYQRDADGQAEFVGRDVIDHTPKDEPVRIRIGYAYDLVASRVQTANRAKSGEKWNEQDWEITLRNHKDQAVNVLVEELLDGNKNREILRSSRQYEKQDFRTLQYNVEVPANGQTTITYTVRYTWYGA